MELQAKSKRILLFVFSGLATYAITYCFLLALLHRTQTIDNDYLAALQTIEEINNDHAPKMIIFGSSMAREGIDQEILGKNGLGLRVYNLAISGARPSDYNLILQRIRDKKKIQHVLITLSPWAFEMKHTDDIIAGSDALTNLLFDPATILRLGYNKKLDIRWFLVQTLSLATPWFRYDQDGKELALRSVKLLISNDKIQSEWQQYQYTENKPESYFTEELAKKSNYDEYSNSNFYWNTGKSLQLKALDGLISGLEDRNIPFEVIDMPVNPLAKQLYGAGMEENYRQAVALAIPADVKFHDFSSIYGKDDFIDFDHLNSKGRVAFSNGLLSLMQKDHGFQLH